MIVLQALLSVVFVAVQSFNLLRRTIRLAVTAAVLVVLAVALGLEPSGWESAIFLAVVSGLIIGKKFNAEIEDDMTVRKTENQLPLLGKGRHWRLYVDPVYGFRYRHRLFRDEWSRRRLIIRSVRLPVALSGRVPELWDARPGRHQARRD